MDTVAGDTAVRRAPLFFGAGCNMQLSRSGSDCSVSPPALLVPCAPSLSHVLQHNTTTGDYNTRAQMRIISSETYLIEIFRFGFTSASRRQMLRFRSVSSLCSETHGGE